mmetsp:Transcript_8687/g.21921  ORF Transcript_8687/g.21921 Transcript_8687/m.21921 type:complete len:295 (-) Transcript_8687:308-1192(-)
MERAHGGRPARPGRRAVHQPPRVWPHRPALAAPGADADAAAGHTVAQPAAHGGAAPGQPAGHDARARAARRHARGRLWAAGHGAHPARRARGGPRAGRAARGLRGAAQQHLPAERGAGVPAQRGGRERHHAHQAAGPAPPGGVPPRGPGAAPPRAPLCRRPRGHGAPGHPRAGARPPARRPQRGRRVCSAGEHHACRRGRPAGVYLGADPRDGRPADAAAGGRPAAPPAHVSRHFLLGGRAAGGRDPHRRLGLCARLVGRPDGGAGPAVGAAGRVAAPAVAVGGREFCGEVYLA